MRDAVHIAFSLCEMEKVKISVGIGKGRASRIYRDLCDQ